MDIRLVRITPYGLMFSVTVRVWCLQTFYLNELGLYRHGCSLFWYTQPQLENKNDS